MKLKISLITVAIGLLLQLGCLEKEKESDLTCFECIVVDSLIARSKIVDYSYLERVDIIKEAFQKIYEVESDSLKVVYLFKVSDLFLRNKSIENFRNSSIEMLKIAIKIEDSLKIADYYWNMGTYFSLKEELDSSYISFNQARLIFKQNNHSFYKAKMEYNIAYVLRRTKNYIESEKFAFQAINSLKGLDKKLLLYRCYNHLGLLYNDLNNYEASLKYHYKAVRLIPTISRPGILKERSLNNISLVFRNQGKFDEAVDVIDKALRNKNLKRLSTNLFIKLIDNRAYCQFLNGIEDNVLTDFNAALFLRDSLNNKVGVHLSKTHLTEYYLKYNDTIAAHQNAMDSYKLAVELDLPGALLGSLNLLSRTDPANASEYMHKYIKLNDSLMLAERRVRDKFSRIRFETEEYIEQNIELKEKNVWISISSALSLVSIGLLFFVYRQKSKNRQLVLEKNQKEQNEEIYDLMLKQQNREEHGRIEERMRISEELHDGVLARLFSIRIGLGFFNIQGKLKEGEKFDKLTQELQIVEKEIRNLSHALKNEELTAKKDFPNLLESLTKSQGVIGNFSCRLIIDNGLAWNLVSDQIKINLYRMIQESIFNIIKHAQCSNVDISIRRKDRMIELKIVDNGRGFDTNKKKRGIGLNNIRSRAKYIGGRISIESEKQKGTTLKLTIPTKTFYNEAVSKSSDR
ncbi:sensor histidine kinase [Lutimonas saemankumensis]|uniref:tetratricopeptide repeat-containing sensor histidine kinase n=1 Tax=Lutimonas saemankumensis TaxID=483016 RepID=UPI001CD1F065|nr:sensor histidine kinase [Lutimonas saemankumensis]MCA0931577.1 sensor histidine kinase [Lutimonas saemankumensis]